MEVGAVIASLDSTGLCTIIYAHRRVIPICEAVKVMPVISSALLVLVCGVG